MPFEILPWNKGATHSLRESASHQLAAVCETLAGWLNGAEPQDPAWSPKTWQTFRTASQVHGVGPLLHRRLERAAWLDPALRTWLADQYALNSRRIAKMQVELKEILALFREHRLPAMPLKGSILAATYYEDPGLRPMADLDLLVRPGDFERAAGLLAHLGYAQDVVHWKHIEFIKPDNRRVVSREGEHPDNPRGLEVHLYCRETFGGPTVDLTGTMWAGASRGTVCGEEATLSRPEALWLHLAVHATYHLWQGKGRLIHLVDLARLTPHVEDPARWLQPVDARFTYPVLAMLSAYFPTALPGSLLAAQRGRVSASFDRWARSRDLVNTSHLNPAPPGLYLLKALKLTEGRPGEVMQALRFAFLPSPAELALDHPRLAKSKAPWLAYFLLPLDWIKRVVKKGD
ncbi:MAG: nucleotidyltransferase family protein [Anaerolineae bacterium]